MGWGKAMVVLGVFTVLIVNVTLTVGIKSVQDNWLMYRCNPLLMPFVSSFAPPGTKITAEENFTYCIQDSMTNFAPALLQPLTYVQGMTMDLVGSLTTSTQQTATQSSWIQSSVGNVLSSIYGVFEGLVSNFNVLITKMVDVQEKIMGIITAMLYIMSTVNSAFISMWNGIPGSMIKSFSKLSKK
jgi:hypothetical protein